MKTKYKILFLNPIDQTPFEHFLNAMAQKGWHPIKCSLFYIKFQYFSDKQVHYHIEYETRKAPFNDDNEAKKKIELFEEFEYHKILSYQPFDIYISENEEIEPLTDEATTLEQRKWYSRSFLIKPFLNIIFILSIIYSNSASIIPLLLNPFLPFIIVISIAMFSMQLFEFYRTLQYRKNINIYRKGKFKSPSTDTITIAYIIIVVLFFCFLLIDSVNLFKMNILLIILGVTAIFYLSYRIINRLNVIQSSKITLFMALSLISTFFFLTTALKTEPDSSSSRSEVVPLSSLGLEIDTSSFSTQYVGIINKKSSGVLATVTFSYNDSVIEYYDIHHSLLSSLVRYGAYKKIPWIEKTQLCNYDISLSNTECYLYQEGNIIISSYSVLPREFIESLQSLHKD